MYQPSFWKRTNFRELRSFAVCSSQIRLNYLKWLTCCGWNATLLLTFVKRIQLHNPKQKVGDFVWLGIFVFLFNFSITEYIFLAILGIAWHISNAFACKCFYTINDHCSNALQINWVVSIKVENWSLISPTEGLVGRYSSKQMFLFTEKYPYWSLFLGK